jgi:DNA-binding transcriptional MerR regulator
MGQTLHIGEFAKAVGTSPKTIRFYEEAGVLPPARRSEQGWRLYDSKDIARLRFVRGARSIGLGLNEIRRFLSHRDRGEPACNDVLESIGKQIAEVDRQIEALGRLREDLERLHADGLARPVDRNDMLGCVCELVGTRAR